MPGSPRGLLALATPRRYAQPDYYRRVAGRIYGGQARRDPDALPHGSPARFIERPSMWGYLGQLYAIAGWTSLPWLHRLRQPTLVLAGDDDPIVPLVNGWILARRIPAARLHVVDGGGHLFLLEQPARIAAVVVGFLELAGEGGHGGRTTAGPGSTRAGPLPRARAGRVAGAADRDRREGRTGAIGFQISLASTVECDAAPKPACAAQVLCRFVGPAGPVGAAPESDLD